MNKSDIPVFKLVLDEDSEIQGIQILSMVDQPAIELLALKFSKEEKTIQFKITDNSRQIFMAPILRPDFLIFQNRESPFYGYFDKETIFKASQKYFRDGKIGNIDINHSERLIKGAYLFESFIIDSSRGILTPVSYGQTLPDGTWFGSFQVTDPELWASIEAGKINGISIDGIFSAESIRKQMSKTNLENVYQEINDILTELN